MRLLRQNEYSVPENVDGYFLTLKFSMTNPYDQEMMAPVPDYYYLTSAGGEWFASSTTDHRDCSCRITNYSDIFTADGKMLFLSAEGKCGAGDWCIRFAANETKEFEIQFKEPIFGEVKKVVFSGFGLMRSIPDGRRKRDKGIIIDTELKQAVGIRSF